MNYINTINTKSELNDSDTETSNNDGTTYIPLPAGQSSIEQQLAAKEQEYYMHTKDANGNTTIVSTLDDFKIGGTADFNSDKDEQNPEHQTVIIADQVTIIGRFEANELILIGNISAKPDAALDVSGAPIPDLQSAPTGDGKSASPGNNAGTIQVFSEQVPADPIPDFLAQGGNGQNGQIASSGTGGGSGKGGSGGNVSLQIFSPYLSAIDSISDVLKNLTKGGIIELANKLESAFPDQKADFEKVKDYANKLFPDQTNQLDPTYLTDLTALLGQISDYFSAESDSIKTDLTAKINTMPGDTGEVGTGTEGNGQYGEYGSDPKAGDVNVSLFDRTPILGDLNFSEDIFEGAFLLQTKMLLQKAKQNYMMADSVSNKDALTATGVTLQRLIKRLDFVPENTNSEGNVSSAILPYKSIYNEAISYFRRFSTGDDFYGNGYDYVPLVALQKYIDLLPQLIDNFEEINGTYSDYFSELQDEKKTLANVQYMSAVSQQVISQTNSNISELNQALDLTAQSIAQYGTAISNKKDVLTAALTKTENDIKDYYNPPNGFEIFSDVVSAASQMAFAPESNFLKVAQGGGTIANLINSFGPKATSTITDDKGQTINKDYLIDQVVAVKDDVSNLYEGYTELSDGTLDSSDPGASKLLAQESNIESVLNNFKDAIPDDVKAVKDAFSEYIKVITARNTLVLKYNALVDVLTKNFSQKSQAEDAINQANKVSSDLDPALPEVVNTMADINNATRLQVMDVAYQASRALQFWSLSDTNFLAEAMSIGSNGMVPSSITFDFINNAFNIQLLNALKNFSTNPTNFPANDNEEGATIEFGDDATIQTLKKENTVMLTIPEIYKNADLSSSWKNNLLHNQSNIRITNVSVWIEGAQVLKNGEPVDDLIQVSITHGGRETLVSQNNNAYSFSHDSVNKTFAYKSQSKEIDMNANFGDLNKDDPTQGINFALLGPFTNWTITVENTAPSQTMDIIQAVEQGKVQKDGYIQVDGVKYQVASINTNGIKTEITASLFGMDKTYTIESGQVTDSEGNVVTGALAYIQIDSASYVDLSNVTAIQLEFSGTSYTFN